MTSPGQGQNSKNIRTKGSIWGSDGSAGGLTVLSLCCGIIRWLFDPLWSWNDDPSLEDALSRLPKVVDSARALARGRWVNVPAVVAIHNVGLTSDRAIPIGSAVLRRPIRFDRSHLLGVRLGPDMDETQAAEIRELCSIGLSEVHQKHSKHCCHPWKHRLLAEKFGVSESVVRGIVTGRGWKHTSQPGLVA